MKEDEGSRYLSPLVKQDLANLSTDGDTRRDAIKSLKLFVEQLDPSTLPRFITQIAESRESGGTRSYAISLFEEAARVHGKLIVPHISKVMGSLVRSSSASGSFPQLQLACARVTAALARYGIDSNTSQEDAEKIMQEICAPLIEALAGKLEPVTANAAACIHALVETDPWKYAHDEIVHEVCQRTTVALCEKPTRTASHMQLACILASANPDTLSIYGVSLLRAGEDILKVAGNSWQLRKAAAKLLQSVLTILDKETLESELHSALHSLDSCRLDKMPHVRAAVSEALHTAKMLASGDATLKSFGTAASPIRKTTECNDWSEDNPVSSVSKRGTSQRAVSPSPVPKRGTSPRAPSSPNLGAARPISQESRRRSYSSASTSTSESAQVPSTQSNGRSRAKRAPLYPPRGMVHAHSPRSAGTPGTSPSSSTTTVEECESPSRRLVIARENVRSRSTKVNGLYPEEDETGHGDKYLRPLASLTSAAFTALLPTQLDTSGVEVQKLKEFPSSKNVGTVVPTPERLSNTSKDTTKDRFSRAIPEQFLGGFEAAGQAKLKLPRLKLGGINSQTVPANDIARVERKNGNNAANADVEVEKRQIFATDKPIRTQKSAPAGAEFNTGKLGVSTYGELNALTHRYNAVAHVGVNLEEETTKSRSMAKGFLPFVPRTRLVRSLSSLSNPESTASLFEHNMTLSQGDVLRSNNVDAAELDGETSSEAGWSVRDNPIASEESYRSDSSDEDLDQRRRGDDFSRLRKVGSLDSCSPREIHMILPEPIFVRSDRASNPEEVNDAHHICPSCVLAEQSFTSCRMRIPSQDGGKALSASGLSNLLHKDEITRDNVAEESECTSPSVKEIENQNDQGRGRFSILRHWKKLCWYTEAALGGSLFLVLALPVAMFIAKALTGSRDLEDLVPT